jgi:hypothetical protein
MQASRLPPHVSQWRWTCSFYGKPGGDSGSGVDLDDCKAKFRVAWSRIRARADGCGHREGARDAALTAIINIAGSGKPLGRPMKFSARSPSPASSIGQQRWLDQHHRAYRWPDTLATHRASFH